MSIRHIRIGTRGSALALAQTELVEQALREKYPDIEFERIIYKTEADRDNRKPLVEFGGTGVFVKKLERALLDGEIDIAVHSAKDMPVMVSEGLCIAGVLPRDDVRDVLVYRKEYGNSVNEICAPFTVGTGSPRRQSQLEALYPHFTCVGVRGNVPTRLDKVRKGECDGVILAAAGLRRLGLLNQQEFCYHFFPEEDMLPAGGQAIIAIECRVSDAMVPLVRTISDDAAMLELLAEQQVLRLMNAGCHEPIAVRACVSESEISIDAVRAIISENRDVKSMLHVSGTEDEDDNFHMVVSEKQIRKFQAFGDSIHRVCKKGKRSEWEWLATEVAAQL